MQVLDLARSAVGEWVVSLKMVAGADLRRVILRLQGYDANCVVSSLWGGTSTFDLFQFTDATPETPGA